MPVDKSGRVFLVGSVPLLHPEVQTVEEMLDGWRNQQLCRNLDPDTIDDRVGLVRRFIAHTNEYPWSWTPAIVEEFFADLRGIKGRAQSTVRGYQNGLRLFCSYIADPDYGWDRVCEQRFGTHPAQVFFAWNTATHVQDNEQNPEKRPFTKQELQDFFDHADDQVTLIASAKKKGWLPTYRDAVMFKVAYSYGVRFNELRHLQTVDFSRNPHAPEFGRYGVVKVRYGKAKKGSPPKRRTVLTVFDWTPDIITDWLTHGQPYLDDGIDLFPSERGSLVAENTLLRRFRRYCNDLELSGGLDLHSFGAPTSPTSSKTAGTPSSSKTRLATNTPARPRSTPASPATSAPAPCAGCSTKRSRMHLTFGEETS